MPVEQHSSPELAQQMAFKWVDGRYPNPGFGSANRKAVALEPRRIAAIKD